VLLCVCSAFLALRYRCVELTNAANAVCLCFAADAELLEMIERADTDTDGEISPDEFYAIMTKKTFT
jgi:hypothetical protein